MAALNTRNWRTATQEQKDEFVREQIKAYLDLDNSNEAKAEELVYKIFKARGKPRPNIIWFDSPVGLSNGGGGVFPGAHHRIVQELSAENMPMFRPRFVELEETRRKIEVVLYEQASENLPYNVHSLIWADFYSVGKLVLKDPALRAYCKLAELVYGLLDSKEGDVSLVRKPIRLVLDADNILHYDHDKAIEWRDGSGGYYIHGVEFNEEPWRKIVDQKMTLSDFASAGLGSDQRAAALQMLRPDLLLEQVKAGLVDTGKRGAKLYEVPDFMDTGDTEYCLLMNHPTVKGKQYLEWVHPEVGAKKDADLAMATNRGLTTEQYLVADLA